MVADGVPDEPRDLWSCGTRSDSVVLVHTGMHRDASTDVSKG